MSNTGIVELATALRHEAEMRKHELKNLEWLRNHVVDLFTCALDYAQEAIDSLELVGKPKCTLEGDAGDGRCFVMVTARTREPLDRLDKNDFMHATHQAIRERYNPRVISRVEFVIEAADERTCDGVTLTVSNSLETSHEIESLLPEELLKTYKARGKIHDGGLEDLVYVSDWPQPGKVPEALRELTPIEMLTCEPPTDEELQAALDKGREEAQAYLSNSVNVIPPGLRFK